MLVDTKLLSDGAKKPCFMTKGAACADVYLPGNITIPAGKAVRVPLDISFSMPAGYKIVMYPRSSLLIKRGLMSPVSIIDADYTGCVHVPLFNVTSEDVDLKAGERVAQIELYKNESRYSVDWEQDDIERDQNGFGGTGL